MIQALIDRFTDFDWAIGDCVSQGLLSRVVLRAAVKIAQLIDRFTDSPIHRFTGRHVDRIVDGRSGSRPRSTRQSVNRSISKSVNRLSLNR